MTHIHNHHVDSINIHSMVYVVVNGGILELMVNVIIVHLIRDMIGIRIVVFVILDIILWGKLLWLYHISRWIPVVPIRTIQPIPILIRVDLMEYLRSRLICYLEVIMTIPLSTEMDPISTISLLRHHWDTNDLDEHLLLLNISQRGLIGELVWGN